MRAPAQDNGSHHKQSWMFWRRKRHLVTFLAFLGFVKMHTLKVSVSVAAVAMTSPYHTTLDNGTVVEVQDFTWNSKMLGNFLGSYFYGFVSTQLLGGWLGSRVGGARLFGWGFGITAVITVITPPIAYTNFYLLLITRALTGFFEGIGYPCLMEIWSKWIPPQERMNLLSIALSGVPVGTVVGLQSGGLIADYLGWAFIFYITGVLGICWTIVWLLVVKDRPEYDLHISSEELKYIKDSMEVTTENKHTNHPWKKLFTSTPVWAIAVGIICQTWGHMTFITQLPKFMTDVYNFRLAQSGFLTSLPYIVLGIVSQFTGRLGDWLKNEKILTISQVRKIFGCGSLFLQAAILVLSTQFDSATLVILCLITLLGLEAFGIAVIPSNGLYLAPQHAGVIFGLGCTLGSVTGILSPLLSGYIVTDKSKEQWKIVFYIASGLYVFGGIFYGLFSSSKLQPWAKDNNNVPGHKEDHINNTL
ncbi:vesicular glutamate transporter 1-like isoform X3 [Homalodisca vitripennis]|uniref:vesicular glutamate transporter 1-like isoform X3 n=1 Tax=Homalodisca vitripennis TaxID=197043 RepID=UPI001EEBA460|nr:vesicular glutamate transporter 1-like isoform X3 [Homalodisca vitripennis]